MKCFHVCSANTEVAGNVGLTGMIHLSLCAFNRLKQPLRQGYKPRAVENILPPLHITLVMLLSACITASY